MSHPLASLATPVPADAAIPFSVLVVDDDPVLIATLKALITSTGHSVRAASNGLEAWESLQHNPAAIVISDWHMPGLDGLELCRRIRARAHQRYVYFILITAYGGKQQYALGMDAGADDFITKPLDLDELRARLHVADRILGLQQHLRRLEGLLPICAYCKRIRDESGAWESLEGFIGGRSEAQFSHGVCDVCEAKVFGDQLDQLTGCP
jgi:phosphoserine phosphatase RsbU/P